MYKNNKKTYGLLACLMWLLLVSQESAAAQENLLSTQRLLAPPGAPVVKKIPPKAKPARVAPRVVVPAPGLSATKPDRLKKPSRKQVLPPIRLPARQMTPAKGRSGSLPGASGRPAAPVRVAPALPSPRSLPAIAPVQNPRLRPVVKSPSLRTPTRVGGGASAPRQGGFALSPMTRPEGRPASQTRRANQHIGSQSPATNNTMRHSGLEPVQRGSNPASSSAGGGFAGTRDNGRKSPRLGAGVPAPPAPSSSKVPDSYANAPSPVGAGSIGNGDIVRDENNGSKTTRHLDGSTETFDRNNGSLYTNPGIKASPAADGGTYVNDPKSGTRAHFGGGQVENDPGEIKDIGAGRGQTPEGGRVTDERNGSITLRNSDGTTDTWQSDGSHLSTGAGLKTVPTADGGTEVLDSGGKSLAHFGGGEVSSETSQAKYIGGGTVQEPDGQKHQGKKPESMRNGFGSDDSGASTDDSNNASADDSSSDSDSSSSSSDDSSRSDDSSDDDSADDSSDSSSDDSASSDDDSEDNDSSDDDAGSDEARTDFEGGRSSDGGPSATTVIDDRVARMKGEKRDPESPDDEEPGNGGSAPDSVSQPGPRGGHRGSPLARPSAEGHSSPVGSVVVPLAKTRSSVGKGDCFKTGGCDNAPTGGFKLDPLNRDPVTNPGGG